ncbi:DUF2993 domain-containing protein [Microbacterium protaetiae]|uniref:DUF2993 domain-containing protein n=1 Tax=Microbacterium protaetiae TaxID=2509458 RepID=A0A4P6EEH9_9MICO|nr:LmeA family phospholipid-binding protein [Microbacterium protaetiae]QAY60715.1 DUF2993 domain-containing protein [Microbacterium protaetiae]
MADRPALPPDEPTEPIEVPPKPPLPSAGRAAPAVEPEATTLPLPVVDAAAQAYPQAAYPQQYPQPAYPQTAVAPQAYPQTAVAPQAAASLPAPKKKRRGVVALVTTVIIVVVLAGAGVVSWFAGNAWAKDKVIAEVTQQTRTALDLDADQKVDVQVAEPMLPQLLAGTLSTLSITVPDAPLAGTTGSLTVHATDVSTDGGALGSAEATVTLTPDAITKLIGTFDDTVAGSLKVDGSNVTVDLNPSQFLSGISFALTLTPSAHDGALVLTPVKFTVGGASMDADTIRARFGTLAEGILADRTVCVADQFPKGLTLSKITVGSDAVDASFTVDPRTLSDPSLQKPGTCG